MTNRNDTNRTAPLKPLPIDIVSVQSQVVYGSVGNCVALPIFQKHGFQVAPVPTVVFSNTPHYPSINGGPLPTDWFAGWLADLHARDALRHLRAIQVGFLGSAGQAKALAQWIEPLVASAPEVRVHIDPVIGDHDHGVYIDPAIVAIYREHLLPLAHGLFPNSFELGHLTQLPTDTMDEIIAAARTLLVSNTQWVIVTSAAPDTWRDGHMYVAIVTPTDSHILEHTRIDAAPKGTGDTFSAVVTSQLLAGHPLLQAAHTACETVVTAVSLTHTHNSAELLLPD